MINEFITKSKKIIEVKSKELHKLRLKSDQDNSENEIAALRRYIKNENQFKIVELIVIDGNYIEIIIRWRGLNFGKYFIY